MPEQMIYIMMIIFLWTSIFSKFYCSNEEGIELPPVGEYATGLLFLKNDSYEQAIEAFTDLAKGCNLKVIAWRKLQTNPEKIGAEARKTEPCIRQVRLPFLLSPFSQILKYICFFKSS